MPITQDRIITLIQAARAFERALADTRRELSQRIGIVARGGNAAAELEELSAIIRPELMVPDYVRHVANLSVEERHFATHQRGNEKRAQRAERKRREGGTRQADTAPPTLIPGRKPSKLLTARTWQPLSVYDEGAEAPAAAAAAAADSSDPAPFLLDPSLNEDPESLGEPRFGGLTDERKAELDREVAEMLGEQGGGGGGN